MADLSSYYFSQGTSGNVIQIKMVGTGAAAAGLSRFTTRKR